MTRSYKISLLLILTMVWSCSEETRGGDTKSNSSGIGDSIGGSIQSEKDSESGEEENDDGLQSLPTPEDADDDDDDESSNTDNSETPSTDCGEVEFVAEPVPPNVMMVVDKSGSMSRESWMDDGVLKTRWQSLYEVVEFLLEEFDMSVNFGMKFFPKLGTPEGNIPGIACLVDDGVEVPIMPMNGQAIMDAMPAADDMVYGNTPTNTGLREAVLYMGTLDPQTPAAIILVVDGRTNCNQTDAQLQATAAAAWSNNIPVYVVGVDVDAPTAGSLQPLAEAGGTMMFHNSTDADGLKQTLEGLLGKITSCVVPLDPEPPFPEHVAVELEGGKEVPWLEGFSSCEEAAAAGMADGWVYTKEYGEIEICGALCEEFIGHGMVDITYECPPPG